MLISKVLAATTIWSAGPTNATAAKITPLHAVTSPTTLSAMRISTNMADGAARLSTAPSGSHIPLSWAGRRTATATGSGFRPGDTPGSMTSLGASRHSITAVGLRFAARGVGCRAGPQPWWASRTYVLFTRLRLSRGLADPTLPWVWPLVVVQRWVGSRWGRVKCTFLPTP